MLTLFVGRTLDLAGRSFLNTAVASRPRKHDDPWIWQDVDVASTEQKQEE